MNLIVHIVILSCVVTLNLALPGVQRSREAESRAKKRLEHDSSVRTIAENHADLEKRDEQGNKDTALAAQINPSVDIFSIRLGAVVREGLELGKTITKGLISKQKGLWEKIKLKTKMFLIAMKDFVVASISPKFYEALTIGFLEAPKLFIELYEKWDPANPEKYSTTYAPIDTSIYTSTGSPISAGYPTGDPFETVPPPGGISATLSTDLEPLTPVSGIYSTIKI